MDALAKLSAATTALAQAKTLEDVKQIMDIAEAARTYARAAKLGLEAANHAAEVKLRAERKAGELLAELAAQSKEGQRRENQYTVQTFQAGMSANDTPYRTVLTENDIAPTTAHRWQTVATVPDEIFEEHVATVQQEQRELTGAELLALAKKLKREVNRLERQAEETITLSQMPQHDDRYRLFTSDIQSLQIEPESIDAIVTDPPYPQEYLPLYADLADLAMSALKPAGSLFVMCGQSYLPEIMQILCERMTYNWTLAYLTPGGQSPQIWHRKVNSFWKPVIWMVKQPYSGKWLGDVSRSDTNDNDKRFHHWGQSISGMVDLIERCTAVGDVVLDPFCGGGATGVAALLSNRFFVGADVSADAVDTTRARLMEVCNASI